MLKSEEDEPFENVIRRLLWRQKSSILLSNAGATLSADFRSVSNLFFSAFSDHRSETKQK